MGKHPGLTPVSGDWFQFASNIRCGDVRLLLAESEGICLSEEIMAKRVAYMGMLTALAFVFSYIEFLLPINLGVPGIKLGLANLVVIIALYMMDARRAFTLSLVRILLTGLTFGNPASMIYSLAGGMLSLAIMILARKCKIFSVTGVSILGGVFHNVGQILVAAVVVETASLLYYLPVLVLSGTVAGVAIGILASVIIRRLSRNTASAGNACERE